MRARVRAFCLFMVTNSRSAGEERRQRPSLYALWIRQRGDFGEGAVLSEPPPRHSWVATEFGLFVTDLYLDPTENERRAIPGFSVLLLFSPEVKINWILSDLSFRRCAADSTDKYSFQADTSVHSQIKYLLCG